MTELIRDAIPDPMYLLLSSEVRQLLAKNNVSLADILTRADLDSQEAREVPDPAQQPEGTREAVMIILASAAVIGALTPVVTNIVRAYTNKGPVLVEDSELIPALDGKGNVIRRHDGEPVMIWRRTNRLLSPSIEPASEKVAIKALGVQISIEQNSRGKTRG